MKQILLFVLALSAKATVFAAIEHKAMASNEACEAALEKKATYNHLIAKLGSEENINVSEVLSEIKRASLDYKDLNSYCKR